MKIISFSYPTSEGIVLELDKPISMNGGIKTKEWWLSWDRMSELLTKGAEA